MLFLFIFRLLRRLFLVFVQLLQNGRFFLRLFPCIPINSVSQLYGTSDIGYWKYLVVSLLGFSYKLFSYTIIGRNVYDPLSAKFMLPFVFLFLFSGFVLLGLNGVLGLTGYISHEEGSIAQNAATNKALFLMTVLVPALGYLLMLLPMHFYNITGESHRKMMEEVKERRAALAAEQEA